MSLKYTKKSAKIPPISKELFKIGIRHSVHSAFGKFIGSSLQSIDYDDFPYEIRYHYHIPAALCHEVQSPNSENRLILSTSAVLAIFDELSTYTLLLEDKTSRPGVSVDLSVDVIQPAFAGEEVVIVTRSDKIGKILAFSSIEMRRGGKDGDLLARGKHVKYLPMGWLFETVVSSFLASIVLFFYSLFYGKFRTPVDHLFSTSSTASPSSTTLDPLLSKAQAVFEVLEIKENENPVDRKAFGGEEGDVGLYDFRVKKQLTNLLGSLHGGAVATSVEDAARKYKLSRQPQLEPYLRLKSLTIRYMSAMKVSDVREIIYDVTVLSVGRTRHQSE